MKLIRKPNNTGKIVKMIIEAIKITRNKAI